MKRETIEGTKAPGVLLPDKDSAPIDLATFRGKWVVLYFYPKDNTSGCTREGVEFTAAVDQFRAKDAEIVGVSPDSPKSHCAFAQKHGLDIVLLSDTEHEAVEEYGVWVEKNRYGKKYWGVDRSTFLIDPEGVVRAVWRNVKVDGHAQEVYDRMLELQQA